MKRLDICQICGQECNGIYGLGYHLTKTHNLNLIQKQQYYDDCIIENISDSFCFCGDKKRFLTFSKGYDKTCHNKKCIDYLANKNRKKTKLERYGDENYVGQDTFKKNCLEKYGVDHPNKVPEIKDRGKKTCLERYGYENPGQVPEFKQKTRETSMKNYGVDHHLKAPAVIQKREETCLREYGVKNVFQAESVKVKIKEVWEENYPEGNPNRNSEVRDKIEETTLKNHGVRCILSLNPNQEKSKRSFLNTALKVILDRLKDNYIPLFAQEEYQGTPYIYKWKCIKCSNEFEDYIYNSHPRCPLCFPGKFGGSSFTEKEIAYFIEQYIPILTNKRFSIENSNKKFEIDIFIPSLNIGIEYNGIKWHSENFGNKGKDFRINKTIECEKQGIHLIHIFEHEWLEKQNIIKSVLLSKIGKNEYVIPARKCKIKEVNHIDSNNFLISNHIQGSCQSSIRYGLYYEDQLVSLMTFGKSRFNKQYDFELLRYCNILNTTVIGGFSKLLKYFKTQHKASIISYADRRFSNGDIYEKNNFELLHTSPPNYYYISPKLTIHNRIQFQKHKLKEVLDTFDENLTEWENMKNNKYDRFWDCGNLVYALK